MVHIFATEAYDAHVILNALIQVVTLNETL